MLGNWNRLREKRQGISLHYDASANDAGAVDWLVNDTRCKVSYTKLILDDGRVVRVAPDNVRQWSEGVCRPSSDKFTYKDANSAFYALCVAATNGDKIKPLQYKALVAECVSYFKLEGWGESDVWRITTHSAEAWPRERKVDIAGTSFIRGVPNPNYPLCDIESVRHDVAQTLRSGNVLESSTP